MKQKLVIDGEEIWEKKVMNSNNSSEKYNKRILKYSEFNNIDTLGEEEWFENKYKDVRSGRDIFFGLDEYLNEARRLPNSLPVVCYGETADGNILTGQEGIIAKSVSADTYKVKFPSSKAMIIKKANLAPVKKKSEVKKKLSQFKQNHKLITVTISLLDLIDNVNNAKKAVEVLNFLNRNFGTIVNIPNSEPLEKTDVIKYINSYDGEAIYFNTTYLKVKELEDKDPLEISFTFPYIVKDFVEKVYPEVDWIYYEDLFIEMRRKWEDMDPWGEERWFE
jgi:hypothetical protein